MPFACHGVAADKALKEKDYFFGCGRVVGVLASIPCRFPAILAGALYGPLTITRHLLIYARLWTEPDGTCHGAQCGAAGVRRHIFPWRKRRFTGLQRRGGATNPRRD